MQHAISQSLKTAYAHHIQRLMVTGNFCLISGIDPAEVDSWYLGIYIDAIEWVEMPNTRGMSQFADEAIIATKPYAASGNYINKMSDYCGDCHYQVNEKVTENACPLNSLYWHFMQRHRERFETNPRIGMVYRNWDKQAEASRQATLTRAQWCLENMDEL
jgi:deoxyribodipyrimidine photolyase-related protein